MTMEIVCYLSKETFGLSLVWTVARRSCTRKQLNSIIEQELLCRREGKIQTHLKPSLSIDTVVRNTLLLVPLQT